MVRWLRAAVVPLMLVGLIALSGLVLGRIYADPLLAQLVSGAALGSVAAGVAARRLPSWTVAPLSVLLLAGYTALALRIAARRVELTDPLPTVISDALINGIPRLLTALIPVESAPDTVVVPVVAAWLAGLAGAEIAVRGGRVLLGCVPAAALYAGALYVVGPNAAAAGWPTLAFAGLVVAGLATSKSGDGTNLAEVPASTRAAVRGRALAGAAAGLAVVVGLIALVGPWVGGRVSATPVDPRRYVEPPQVDALDESPLNRISGWALTPTERLLDVSTGLSATAAPTTPAPPPETANPAAPDPSGEPGSSDQSPTGRRLRLRLAVLSDYDGVTWRVGATYRNAGRILPTQPPLPAATVTEVRQSITVDGLTGRLLPVVPTPTEVDGARVAFDAATGTLINPEGLTQGLRYEVTSQQQNPDLNLLPTADSPSGDAVARFLALGANVPAEIQRLADQLAEGNGGAFDRAIAIEEFLGEHYRRVADAPSGHAYPNLEFFLFGSRERGGQVGTSEQFAASFALLARLTGLPARIAVGFDAPAGGGPVTGADAIAWPEVLFDELGWVPFDPMPKGKEPRPVEEDFTPKPSTPPPTQSEAPPPSDEPTASAAPQVLAGRGSGGVPTTVVAGGASGSALLVLAAAATTVLLMRRTQRRRRLTEGAPDDRITGAWLEFTDASRLAGRPIPRHLAATEAAAFAAIPPAPPKPLLRKANPLAGRSSGAPNSAPPLGDQNPQPLPNGDPGHRRPGPDSPPDDLALRGSTGHPDVQQRNPGNSLPPSGGRSPRGPAGYPRAQQLSPGDLASRRPGPDAPPLPPVDQGHGRTARAGGPDAEPLPPLDDLVAGLNTVGFAPGAADEEQARRAGEQAVTYAEALRLRRSWWRRAWWSVHPGPLRWHRDRDWNRDRRQPVRAGTSAS